MNDIFQMIREGHVLNVRSWLDNVENDFTTCDDHGFSLLHWACWDGRLSIVELLIQRGAKINCINNGDDTPLHCAVKNGHYDVTIYLIKQKAPINATNSHGNTPLHYACHFAYPEIAFELINNGGLLFICNKYNQTPFDLCKQPLKNSSIELAKSLKQDLNKIPYKDQRWSLNRSRSSVDASSNNQSSVDLSEFTNAELIDSNHGGQTIKGSFQGMDAVIKVLKVKEQSQKIFNNFNQECKKLRIFNCVNVLPVMFYNNNNQQLVIVSQYMPYRSLFSLLHQQKDVTIDNSKINSLAVGIAKGMNFLHSLEQNVPNIHLNSKHVMIDEDFTAKINLSDYNFSFTDKRKIYNPAWISPEALKYKPEDINKKSSDMWSFAIILWELATRSIPFAQYSAMQCGLKITVEGLRVDLVNGINSHMQKLIRICMNEDPVKRPKFDMIIPILEKLKN